MKQQNGFTVIELIVAIAILITSALLVLYQHNQIAQVTRDKERKTAINAIHRSLEEVYFKQNNHYPSKVDVEILPSVDPALFKDPYGNIINTHESNYRYEPADCRGDRCSSYLLFASLENEARYEKRPIVSD